ncbi:SDR family NAD(P)-dependent oxidoreductase [Natrarchaeobius sp. A-rgal3]|uniref:SDR family NAD(P)-dependent oxidoreductase n=1 Tax=Natrarchaeobius versutus TaxID=1679078 RepID=UPI00350F1E85
MDGITGETALVTGAGSGIGRATAERFAAAGANVVVADVDADGGTETVDAIEDDGGDATFVEGDVADAEDVEAMVDAAVETYGSLAFAHNNAGIGESTGTIAETDAETWERTMAVNLDGVYNCLKAEIPAILENGGGAIVNTASTAGLVGKPGIAHYSASKHGVVGLTRSTALEFADRDVRVNAVCPGIVRTGLAAENPDVLENALEVTPLDRAAQPSEVGDVVVRLCSSDMSFVTGISLPVDGGMTAGVQWR